MNANAAAALLARWTIGVLTLCSPDISQALDARAFADQVVSYVPGIVGSNPTEPHRVPENALGEDDYDGVSSCGATCRFVSLGSGGTLTLRFTDNVVNGSGNSAADLFVYEVSRNETVFVELSADGNDWHGVGTAGPSREVDIDAFGFGPGDEFSYVRLTDDGGGSGPTLGADIDAIGSLTPCVTGLAGYSDRVVDYSPVIGGGGPTPPHQGSGNAVGPADFDGVVDCDTAAECTFVSLGSGGSLTLEFSDNLLTGSGDSETDLFIFEVGGDVEDTFVEISPDGVVWTSIGSVGGSTSSVDLDAFGFGLDDRFRFVRLTDDPSENSTTGNTVGADIDAVCAIASVPAVAAVPSLAPWSVVLLALALVAGAASRMGGGRTGDPR